MTLRAVHLHGDLKERFGGPYHFHIDTPGEAGRALASQVDGFREHVCGGEYRIVKGPLAGANVMDASHLSLRLGKIEEIHIVPVLAGSGGRSKGMMIGKIVLGVVLVAGGAVGGALAAGGFAASIGGAGATGLVAGITWGSIVMTGASLLLTGIAGLLAPTPKIDTPTFNLRERPESRPSFLFNGPVNVIEQGQPIPLVYGRSVTGSIVVSASIVVEDII